MEIWPFYGPPLPKNYLFYFNYEIAQNYFCQVDYTLNIRFVTQNVGIIGSVEIPLGYFQYHCNAVSNETSDFGHT